MADETDVAIIGAGPGGMQAAIDLASAGIDVLLIDKCPGVPEAPSGIITVTKRCHIFGDGDCGHPEGVQDWSDHAECAMDSMLMAGRRVVTRWHPNIVLGYNFTRGALWTLMLESVKICGARVMEGMVTEVNVQDNGITIHIEDPSRKEISIVFAKMVIYAGGIRDGSTIATELGLGIPPMVHGIFTDYSYGGEWTSPSLGFLFNLELVPRGYFWAAYAKKSKRISIGIMNEEYHVQKDLLWRFARTGIIPELKEIPEELDVQSGYLGAVSHVNENTWPVKRVAPRVIGIGEGVGMIAAYIYEGLFSARYQGMIAANVIKEAHSDGSWANPAIGRKYEAQVKKLDDWILKITRMQHHAMYHGGKNGQVSLDAYLKGFNQGHHVIVDAMRSQYLDFQNMSSFEIGLFGAILSHVPLLDKLSVTATLINARLQK